MKYVMLLLFLPLAARTQAVHDVPFASPQNVIELTVENASGIPQSSVRVMPPNAHAWLHFESRDHLIEQLPGSGHSVVRFTFSVDKTAPVNSEHSLSFLITSQSGQSWTKSIAVRISPPQTFQLQQNFPNPFNPTTTIEYQLPVESNVTLKVFDLLGREVANLANGQQQAGLNTASWDASRQSSGMYVYELVAKPPGEKQVVIRRTMMLVK